ncbi:hypothetical protein ACEQPO_05160 [Bacillus sp. SL00103]
MRKLNSSLNVSADKQCHLVPALWPPLHVMRIKRNWITGSLHKDVMLISSIQLACLRTLPIKLDMGQDVTFTEQLAQTKQAAGCI